MDLTPYRDWLKLLHIVGAFLFVAGHGVSMAVAFRIRREREAGRMLALLDLSAWSLGMAGIGLLVVLLSGIISGIVGGYFGRAWIWIAIVILVLVGGLMTPVAGAHFTRIRLALGQRTRTMKPGEPDPVAQPIDDVAALTMAPAPERTAAIGIGGFVVILWLMTFKPF